MAAGWFGVFWVAASPAGELQFIVEPLEQLQCDSLELRDVTRDRVVDSFQGF